MAYPLISDCPVCGKQLKITKLECTHCHTVIENEFELSRFSKLNKDQLHFVETFLKCRGNIKEVEKELGVSYPTVRGKLDDIISSLGYSTIKKAEMDRSKIITMLEKGDITPEEAISMLKKEEA